MDKKEDSQHHESRGGAYFSSHAYDPILISLYSRQTKIKWRRVILKKFVAHDRQVKYLDSD